MTCDLLVVGDANPDVVLTGVPRPIAFGQRERLVGGAALTVGGSGAITACGAARLGLRTAFVGRVGDDPAGGWAGGVGAAIAQADVLLPNEAEALALAGRDDVLAAGEALAASAGLVVVKRGRDGAVAWRDGAPVSVPGPPARPVDTVGAGDSFDAGFLAGWLGGRDLAASLRLAAACGALSTRAAGGTAAQPTMAEALAAAGIEED